MLTSSLLVLTATLGAQPPSAAAVELRDLVAAAVHDARAHEALLVELLEQRVSAHGCAIERAEATAPVVATGAVALRLHGTTSDGRPCTAGASARVRVHRPALRVTNPIARGDDVGGADVELLDQEVRGGGADAAGVLPALPAHARAARPLPRGAWLRAADLDVGPALGAPIVVSVRSGALRIEETGRVAACPGRRTATDDARACASLKGGRRVEGELDAASGTLVVEVHR